MIFTRMHKKGSNMKIRNDITPTIFREYDLRGIYPTDIDSDVAYTLGKSFGSYIQTMGETTTIVGHDNRESGEELYQAFLEGVKETGVHILSLGLVTTPMYYYAKKKEKLKTGVMITASHNPREYNGFKVSFSEIGNAYGDAIKEFQKFTEACEFTEGNGDITPYSIHDDYLALIKNSIKLGRHRMKVVVDCGNGTGSIIVKEVMQQFPIKVEYLYCESDPTFPNHHPDPAVSKNMIDLGKKVVELGYDLGIGIDGDADRVGFVDNKGNVVPIDQFMLLVYRDLNDHLKNRKALFDVKCGKSLIDGLEDLGIEPVMYRTGASYTNMMVNTGDFDFGGEFSGHVFFRDKFPGFDDGIYAGLRMIEILSKKRKSFTKLLKDVPQYVSTEEIKIATTEEKKFDIVEKVKDYAIEEGYAFEDIDGVRIEWWDAWALIRASNTGPNITLRFEAKDQATLDDVQKEFMDFIQTLL